MNVLIAAEPSGGLLDRVAKWLINFDYDAADTEDLTLRFLGMPEGWGLLLTLACVAALIWLTFALYRREGRAASRGRKLFLAGVRTAAILLALLLFLEPPLFESRVRETLSPVIVLVDGSESITIDDLYSDPAAAAGVTAATGLDLAARNRITRQEIITAALNNPEIDFLNRLAAKNPVHVYSFGVNTKELLRLGLAPDPEKTGNPGADGQAPERFRPGTLVLEVQSGRTYLGRAVSAILEQAAAAAPDGLAAIIVISDGQDNDRVLDATASAGEYAAREGVTVFAVPVGLSKSRKTRNIRAAKGLQVNRTLFAGDPAEFIALVSSSGYERPMRIVAKLYRKRLGSDKEEEVASKEESVGVDAVDQPVALKHTPLPGEEGEYIYTLRIAPLDDEHLRRDNAAVAGGIRVVKTSTNVLLIAGSPTWEFRRLRGLLIRDKSATLSCWLQSAGRGYPQAGNRLLRRLPRSSQELAEADYHVVILIDIDPDPAAFDADWFKMLEEFVSDKAGGLLYVAGEKEAARGWPWATAIRALARGRSSRRKTASAARCCGSRPSARSPKESGSRCRAPSGRSRSGRRRRTGPCSCARSTPAAASPSGASSSPCPCWSRASTAAAASRSWASTRRGGGGGAGRDSTIRSGRSASGRSSRGASWAAGNRRSSRPTARAIRSARRRRSRRRCSTRAGSRRGSRASR